MKFLARIARVAAAFALIFGLVAVVEGPAFAMNRCASYCNPFQPNQCCQWIPDYPTTNVYSGGGAGRDCTGAPGPKEINIYSGTNKTGWCTTFIAGNYMDLNSTNGWYSPYYVYGIWVGSSAHGLVYLGAGFTGQTNQVFAGQFYNYSSPSGWHGVYNDTPQ